MEAKLNALPQFITTIDGLDIAQSVTAPKRTHFARRVNATKWPDREQVTDQSQGVQLATMQKLASYWGTEYDWRKCEAKLKALPLIDDDCYQDSK